MSGRSLAPNLLSFRGALPAGQKLTLPANTQRTRFLVRVDSTSGNTAGKAWIGPNAPVSTSDWLELALDDAFTFADGVGSQIQIANTGASEMVVNVISAVDESVGAVIA
jgi:hypothetical protein